MCVPTRPSPQWGHRTSSAPWNVPSGPPSTHPYHYSALCHDKRGLSTGLTLSPSPRGHLAMSALLIVTPEGGAPVTSWVKAGGLVHVTPCTAQPPASTVIEDPILACLACNFNFTRVETFFSGCFRSTLRPRGLCDGVCSCVYPFRCHVIFHTWISDNFSLLLSGGLLGHCSRSGTVRLSRGCQAGPSPRPCPSRAVSRSRRVHLLQHAPPEPRALGPGLRAVLAGLLPRLLADR